MRGPSPTTLFSKASGGEVTGHPAYFGSSPLPLLTVPCGHREQRQRRLGLYRRPGAASQAQEPRRQHFRDAETRLRSTIHAKTPQLAPAETSHRVFHAHRKLHLRAKRCTQCAEQNHRFLGFPAPVAVLGFSASPPVLGFSGSPCGSRVFRFPIIHLQSRAAP